MELLDSEGDMEATRTRSPWPAEQSRMHRYDSDLGIPILVQLSTEELKRDWEKERKQGFRKPVECSMLEAIKEELFKEKGGRFFLTY